MGDINLRALLAGDLGIDDLSAVHRRAVALTIPSYVSAELARGLEPGERTAWSLTLRQWLDEIVAQVAGHWSRGWPELAGAIATAVELLDGGGSTATNPRLEGTPAETHWRAARRPFQRFALLAGVPPVVARVHSTSDGAHAIDAGPTRGRSAELIAALARCDAITAFDGNLAATGTVAGSLIGPVDLVREKAAVWFEVEPEGWLVTPPQDVALLRTQAKHALRWICASTLAEAIDKLCAPGVPLRGWKRQVLSPDSAWQRDLKWLSSQPPLPRRDPRMALTFDTFHEYRDETMLAWAVAHTSDAKVPRGVLITGSPGCGKSTWSRALVQRARTGILGAHGWWQSWTARELADGRRDHGADWEAIAAARVGHRESVARVIPVIDGLDELAPDELTAVAEILAAIPTCWIATSRPVRAVTNRLPQHHHLEIPDLESRRAKELLRELGREDLASRVEKHEVPDDLTRSPLLLSLLCDLVEPGRSPAKLGRSALYERLFERLTDEVSDEARDLGASELRRAVLDVVPGQLASTILSGDAAAFSERDLFVALERAGLSSAPDRAQAIRALAGGHLLVRIGEGWGFAHRTIAEWCAARDVGRRIRIRLDAHEADRATRAAVQREVLAPLLDGPTVLHERPTREVLGFLGPDLPAPLDFLLDLAACEASQRQLPPSTYDSERGARPARADDLRKEWTFVLAFVAESAWRRDEAVAAWALVVRLHLALGGGRPDLVPATFGEGVGRHLPLGWDALVEAANLPVELLDVVQREPTAMLHLIPSVRAASLEWLLQRGTPEQQAAVLKWHEAHSPPVSDRVLSDILNAAKQRRSSSQPAEQVWRRDEVADLAWARALDQGMRLPFTDHRTEVLSVNVCHGSGAARWFGSPRSATPEDRRRALGELLHDATVAVTEQHDLIAVGKASPHAEDLRRQTYGAFDDEDERGRRSSFKTLWEAAAPTQRPSDTPPIAGTIADAVRLVDRRRDAFRQACEQAITVESGEVVTSLWRSLAPGSPELMELQRAVLRASAVPGGLSIDELLDGADLERWWWHKHVEWSSGQIGDWRRLAGNAPRQLRLIAIRVVAALDGADPDVRLVSAAASADPETRALLLQHIRRDQGLVVHTTDSSTSGVPLDLRADRGSPAWRAEVRDTLRGSPLGSPDFTAVSLVREERIDEALPDLLLHAEAAPGDREVADAVVHLLETGSAVGARLLDLALAHSDHGGLQTPYLAFVQPRHLSEFVWRAARGGWLPKDAVPTVASALAAEPGCIRSLLAEVVTQHQQLAAGHASAEDVPWEEHPDHHRGTPEDRDVVTLPVAEKALGILRTLVLLVEGPRAPDAATVVDLAFTVVAGDRHNVYSTPGSLGSDYDEPGDLDFGSNLEGKEVIDTVLGHLDRALDTDTALDPLHRLLHHPSETMRLAAFERLATRVPPHALVDLAVGALEAHIEAPAAQLTGDVSRLWLAHMSSGVGEINVSIPSVASRIEEAVLAVLTRAHATVLDRVLRNEHPSLRVFGARWVAKVGAADLVGRLRALLADAHPVVMRAALDAMRKLAPGDLPTWLDEVDRSKWSTTHIATLLAATLPHEGHLAIEWMLAREEPPERVPVSARLLVDLLRSAGDLTTASTARQLFGGAPSLAERAIDAHPESSEIVRLAVAFGWGASEIPEIAAVGHRLTARSGEIELPLHAERARSGDARVRCSAAELLLARGGTAYRRLAVVTLVSLLRDGWRETIHVRSDEVVRRALSALPAEGSGCGPLISAVLRTVEYDQTELCFGEEDEAIVDVVAAWLVGQPADVWQEILDEVPSDGDGWWLLTMRLPHHVRPPSPAAAIISQLADTDERLREVVEDLKPRQRVDPVDDPSSAAWFGARLRRLVLKT